jgi:hypothetical protein
LQAIASPRNRRKEEEKRREYDVDAAATITTTTMRCEGINGWATSETLNRPVARRRRNMEHSLSMGTPGRIAYRIVR